MNKYLRINYLYKLKMSKKISSTNPSSNLELIRKLEELIEKQDVTINDLNKKINKLEKNTNENKKKINKTEHHIEVIDDVIENIENSIKKKGHTKKLLVNILLREQNLNLIQNLK